MKRLVKIDLASSRYVEIDTVKLERVSQELLDFIYDEIPPNDDPHGIWKWVAPLCRSALNGTLSLPLPYEDLPLKYPMREGLLPDDFDTIYAPFAIPSQARH